MTEPDPPDYVEVGACACEYVPDSRETDPELVLLAAKRRAM